MPFIVIAFLAGITTTLAPCTLPVLPVIFAGSVENPNKFRPLIIVFSLGISVFVFTLLLKATTLLMFIPQSFWGIFSGIILVGYSLTLIWPLAYERLAFKLKFYRSEKLLQSPKNGLLGTILIGAALGPVFASCSPTYAVIVAIMLPQNLALGSFYLALYVLGLMIPLLLIAYGSRTIFQKIKSFSNPNSIIKRVIAVVLFFTGLAVIFGIDKEITEFLLEIC